MREKKFIHFLPQTEELEPNKSTYHLTGAGATSSFLSTYSSTEMDSVTLVFATVNVTAVLAACPVDLVKVILVHGKLIFS
jgi:hypothetical protein